MPQGVFMTIVGPTAVGKDTVKREILARRPDILYVPSTTCREPRVGEVPGVDMHFLSCEDFQARAAEGDFLEHAKYSQHWYGTSRSLLMDALAARRIATKIVEIQGVRLIRQVMPEAKSIFIRPGDIADLEPRLRARTPPMREEDIAKRLATAPIEIAAAHECDHVVTNVHGRLEECIQDVLAIFDRYR
jgi:guanylate kinase